VGVADERVGYARAFLGEEKSMFGRSQHLPAIAANLREIEGRLRSLERRLQRVGTETSANAALAAEGIGEAVASALGGMADRLRGRAESVGTEAAKLGHDALRRLSSEAEDRPLMMIAVALGVGLLIGLSIPRSSSSER
jgi:ElaB/YqjD/DUF883 family membrane-anchored ribosome-binding protein